MGSYVMRGVMLQEVLVLFYERGYDVRGVKSYVMRGVML